MYLWYLKFNKIETVPWLHVFKSIVLHLGLISSQLWASSSTKFSSFARYKICCTKTIIAIEIEKKNQLLFFL